MQPNCVEIQTNFGQNLKMVFIRWACNQFKSLNELVLQLKILTIANKKLTKSFGPFEISNLIVHLHSFICLLSSGFCPELYVLINFGQQSNTNLWQPIENLLSSKLTITFCLFIVQNCRYFLPCCYIFKTTSNVSLLRWW